MKTCSIKNCNYPVWSKGLCRSHSPKTSLKKSNSKPLKKSWLSKAPTEKALIAKEKKKEYTEKQFAMFKEIYTETWQKTCYECECSVDGQSSVNYHHLLYKGVDKYKKYALEKWNIVLVCENCHQKTHTNIDSTPRIKQRTLELKEKYG